MGADLGHAADVTVTSFFPSKPLGAYGDGGALFTQSAENGQRSTAACARMAKGTTRYEVLRTGMNGRLDSMQAAVLLAKLTVFERGAGGAGRVAAFYDRHLGNAVVIPTRVPRFSQCLGDLFRAAAGGVSSRRACRNGCAKTEYRRPCTTPSRCIGNRHMRRVHDGAALPVSDALADRIWRCRSIRI